MLEGVGLMVFLTARSKKKKEKRAKELCVSARTQMHCEGVFLFSMENYSFFSRCVRRMIQGFIKQNDLLFSEPSDV